MKYSRFITDKFSFNKDVNNYRICGYTYNTMVKMFSKRIQRLEKKMKNIKKNFKVRIK